MVSRKSCGILFDTSSALEIGSLGEELELMLMLSLLVSLYATGDGELAKLLALFSVGRLTVLAELELIKGLAFSRMAQDEGARYILIASLQVSGEI